MKEVWKDIEEYDGYQVSNLGRIRTYNKITYTEKHGIRHWKNRIIKFKPSTPTKKCKQGIGYRVSLWKDGKCKDYLVARLVACTFLNYPLDTNLTVNHKDGNRLNNNISNLEFLTREKNIQYGFEHNQYDKCMKKCILTDKHTTYKFISLAKANSFLSRNENYITTNIKKGKNVITNKEGKKYQVYVME